MKKIFVSGGAGVIGLELVPILLKQGHQVIVGDLKNRPLSFPKEVIYIQGDLNDLNKHDLENIAPEIFIHLAATFERSTESYEFWKENFKHNVLLSHHIMSLMKEQKTLERIVFASSYLIYDPNLYQFSEPPISATYLNEDCQVQPRNLTGMAKFSHEMELNFLEKFKSNQFSSVCVRIFRGYGLNSRCVISRWVRSLLNEEEIQIFRPEGLFDYIFARDTAEGLVKLAFCDSLSGIVNLGTGRPRKVKDVIDILRLYFPNMKYKEVDSDILYEASAADITKLKEHINWSPMLDLENTIPEIIEHEKISINSTSNLKLYKKLNILISSASKKISLVNAMKKAATKINPGARIIAGDAAEDALSFFIADDFWQMPNTNDDNLQLILTGCVDRGINIVLPTRDGELVFWARNAAKFREKNIFIIISPLESINNCLDKKAFSDFGIANKLPFILSTFDINEITSDLFVVKERFGAGSKSIGIGLDKSSSLIHASTLENPIFQPLIKGLEISVDAWLYKNFKVKGIVLRKRIKVVDGESLITTTFSNLKLEKQIIEILEKLNLSGPIVLQAIIDSYERLHIIECNTRFGGASTTGITAGIDSLFWSILEANNIEVETYPFIRSSKEIRQIRLTSDYISYGTDF
jgi:carbamoyl-phosphate synthase large subunit